MKKAFEQNVSRSRPRVKLGSLVEEAAAPAVEPTTEVATTPAPATHPAPRAAAPKSRPPDAPPVARASIPDREPEGVPPLPTGRRGAEAVSELLARHAAPPTPAGAAPAAPAARTSEPAPTPVPVARVEPPPAPVDDPEVRRQRLRQRLKAAREQPRPEPLPATAAAAGVLAVERIAALQAELVEVKAKNLALVQELDVSRRQSERATEEARVRVHEARRLAAEVEGRTKLLADLEGELASLEGERDETLLGFQDMRAREAASAEEQQRLVAELADRDRQISDGLAEEERLATEVESYREELDAMRRTVQALGSERELLTRQVAELTAEREELLEARKALEAVHRALTEATAR